MPLHFRCPCGVILGGSDDAAGRGGECPACGKVLVVPDGAVAVAEGEFESTPSAPISVPQPSPPEAPVEPDAALLRQEASEGSVASAEEPAAAWAEPPVAALEETEAPVATIEADLVADAEVEPDEPVPEMVTADEATLPSAVAEMGIGSDLEGPPAGPALEAAEAPLVVAELEGVPDEDVLPAAGAPEGPGPVPEAPVEEPPAPMPGEELPAAELAEGPPVETPPEPVPGVPESLNQLDALGILGPEAAVEEEGAVMEPDDRKRQRAADRSTGRVRRGTGRVGRSSQGRRPRKCRKCGEELPAGGRQCPSCGASVRAVPARSGSGKKIAIALLLVIILGAGGLAGVAYFAPHVLPAGIREALKSINFPMKKAGAGESKPSSPEGAERPGEKPAAGSSDGGASRPRPAGDAARGDVKIDEGPSAREDLNFGAGGFKVPSPPDLSGGPAAPAVPGTGDTEDIDM